MEAEPLTPGRLKKSGNQERQTEYTPYASFRKWDFAPKGAKNRFKKLVHGVNMIA